MNMMSTERTPTFINVRRIWDCWYVICRGCKSRWGYDDWRDAQAKADIHSRHCGGTS